MDRQHIACNVRSFLKEAQTDPAEQARKALRDYPQLQGQMGSYSPMPAPGPQGMAGKTYRQGAAPAAAPTQTANQPGAEDWMSGYSENEQKRIENMGPAQQTAFRSWDPRAQKWYLGLSPEDRKFWDKRNWKNFNEMNAQQRTAAMNRARELKMIQEGRQMAGRAIGYNQRHPRPPQGWRQGGGPQMASAVGQASQFGQPGQIDTGFGGYNRSNGQGFEMPNVSGRGMNFRGIQNAYFNPNGYKRSYV